MNPGVSVRIATRGSSGLSMTLPGRAAGATIVNGREVIVCVAVTRIATGHHRY
jgi:hypothetical protein